MAMAGGLLLIVLVLIAAGFWAMAAATVPPDLKDKALAIELAKQKKTTAEAALKNNGTDAQASLVKASADSLIAERKNYEIALAALKAKQQTDVTTAPAHADSPTITHSWWLATAMILALFLFIGYGLKNRWWAMLIDDRNRMSLSRVQFVAWNLLILGGYWAAAFWNVGAVEGGTGNIMPAMQEDLWMLLGIATASPLLSTLILGSKDAEAGTQTAGTQTAGTQTAGTGTAPPAPPPAPHVTAEQSTVRGSLDVRTSPDAASYLDMFVGEEAGNRSSIDLSRVQNFVFTLVLLVTYAVMLGRMFGALDPGERITQLPDLDKSMIGLLAISHAYYLTAKNGTKAPPTTAPAA